MEKCGPGKNTMLSHKSQDLLNEQICNEWAASREYLKMAYYFKHPTVALEGLYKFFYKQSQEENDHAIMILDYLTRRCAIPKFLPPVKDCNQGYDSLTPLKAFEISLEFEKTVLSQIMQICDAARNDEDSDLLSFLDKLIQEQFTSINQFKCLVSQATRCDTELGHSILDNYMNEKYK